MNVASYDNYMLINSYLTFCFLLFAFFYDNLIAIRCTYFVINRMNRSSQCLKLSLFIGPGIYILATEFAQGKDLWKYYGTH